MNFKRTISIMMAIIMILPIFSLSGCTKEQEAGYKFYKVDKNNLLFEEDKDSYSYYLMQNKDFKNAKNDIILTANNITNAASSEYFTEYEGSEYAFIDEISNWVEWKINIPEDAFYTINIDYRTIANTGNDIEIGLTLDGKLPYEELRSIKLSKLWTDISGDKFECDSDGSDIRPVKKEVYSNLSTGLLDDKGYFSESYGLALTKGEHTIRVKNSGSGVLIKALSLLGESNTIKYEDYIKGKKIDNTNSNVITIEAEHPLYTSESNIYAISDPQDVATTPNSATATKLNTVGSSNWSKNGQTITWEFDVKKEGFYYINTRARQDYAEGMTSYRSVYIDGELPFAEAVSMKFDYDFDWRSVTLGEDESPYYIYLDKGKHTISMSVNPSEISDILLELNKLVLDLNTVYRKIIVITGVEVDIYQDYDLEVKIPKLVDSFKDCRNRMIKIYNNVKKAYGSEGSQASVLAQFAEQLDTFIAHPYEISGGLASYKSNVESVASLLTTMSTQSLLIDKINIVPAGEKSPSVDEDFFTKTKFSFLKFIDSYSLKDKKKENTKEINVWVSTGRDQAQIIKQMIDNQFINKKNINVRLSITDTGTTLLQAALANKGPDVALSIPNDTPVNLAMRGGLVDLKRFDLDSIWDNYYESAWEHLKYQDGVYGIPETQAFDMLFVRDDIMEELNIKVPETWDDLYASFDKIQGNNLMIGINESSAIVGVSGAISTFSKFYFQQGGTFFNEELSATTFDSELSISCLTKVCELYSKYGIDRQVDFFNRFRSGEMALGIAPYSTYNQLVAAAPEISGLWSMHPIPGTKQADGKINRAESSTSTVSIILKAAEKRGLENEAWEFIKWWNSAETQGEYAERLEGIMGTAARYAPANKKAFETIRWSESESELLKQQWEQIYNVREIPGNYYISRALTSVIRNTIDKGTSIRFNIAKYNNDINSEITRKRKEFGLN